MKTYTKEVKKPCLEVHYDDSPESPRHWCNLGYFVTVERRYGSPDTSDTATVVREIVERTGYEAKDLDDHINRVKVEMREVLGEAVKYIVPVYRYEHGLVRYQRGTAGGFDVSNCGFYIVTDSTAKTYGAKDDSTEDDFNRAIDAELDTYSSYANGAVYGFVLHDDKGEEIDSCWGFYDIDDIKEHLPEEYKDEDLDDYLVT